MKLRILAPLIVLGAVVLALVGVVGSGHGTATAAPAAPTSTRRAAPHINPFATALTGTRRLPDPTRGPVTLPEGFDGCDHAYGTLRQCVPWTFPAGSTASPPP